jgi:hypothetical protein
MAVKHMSYRDLPSPVRKIVAGKAIRQARESLSNPTLTPEQVAKVQERITRLQQWTNGTIPAPTAHEVTVDETVGVKENT